jgi:hypothetical protein
MPIDWTALVLLGGFIVAVYVVMIRWDLARRARRERDVDGSDRST